MQNSEQHHEDESRKYEPEDIDLRKLVIGVVVFFAALVGVLWATTELFRIFEDRPEAAPEEEAVDRRPFPRYQQPAGTPRLQISLADSLVRIIARDEILLSTYGPGPSPDSLVRIPIARAMDMLVDGGLPTREGSASFIPGRSRFAESGYMRTSDPVRTHANYFGYDTTRSVTSAEFHVPGHGPDNFRPRIQPPLGRGLLELMPEEKGEPVEIPTETPESREIDR